MSDRIYIVCKEKDEFCEEPDKKELIAKRFTLEQGWLFTCLPKEGITIISADSAEELKAQLEVGGLNDKEKTKITMINAFNDWLKKHQFCKDFEIEMDV